MNVLLLAPSYLNLYQDVISEMKRQGYSVEYIQDKTFKFDPCLIRNKKKSLIKEWIYGEQLKHYWRKKYSQIQYKKVDILFVINGKSYHPCLTDYLKQYNPQVKSILYLWDRTYKNYRFDKYLNSFNDVITFDKIDAKELNARFLPFYWVPQEFPVSQVYDISGFGSFRPDRYELFKDIWETSQKYNLQSFIKLYERPVQDTKFSHAKRILKNILGIKKKKLVPELITNKKLSPSDFRTLTFKSRCIIDTYNTFQEGMTPRFMWALGAGCKIITTNKNCKNYPFYSPDYIYIAESSTPQIPKEFFIMTYTPSQELKEIINQYRIDNWLKEILKNL